VSPVKYELGSYIPEEAILHRNRHEDLKSYIWKFDINGTPGVVCRCQHALTARCQLYEADQREREREREAQSLK
jgi:hypothetical protein